MSLCLQRSIQTEAPKWGMQQNCSKGQRASPFQDLRQEDQMTFNLCHPPGLPHEAQSPTGMSRPLSAQANQLQELWRGSVPPKRCLPNTDGRCGPAAPAKPTMGAFCWAGWPPCLPWVGKRPQQSWQNGYHQSCSGKQNVQSSSVGGRVFWPHYRRGQSPEAKKTGAPGQVRQLGAPVLSPSSPVAPKSQQRKK